MRAAYIKHAVRKAMDLAIIGVAVKIKVEDGVCTDARIALGALRPRRYGRPGRRSPDWQELTDEVIVKASESNEFLSSNL